MSQPPDWLKELPTEKKARLKDWLDAELQSMTRRDLMEAVGAVGVGGAVGGAAMGTMTQDAQAATGGAGTIGTDAERPDVFADTVDSNTVTTKQLTNDYHYAGAYNGADPDARLDNALSAATAGDTIFLEAQPYSANRTISKRLTFHGDGTFPTSGTRIDGDFTWTIQASSIYYGVSLNPSTSDYTVLDFQGSNSWYANAHNSQQGNVINVAGDAILIQGIKNGGVVFQSGSSGGLVDSCINVPVTDNGTNTVGDIA